MKIWKNLYILVNKETHTLIHLELKGEMWKEEVESLASLMNNIHFLNA